MLLQCTSLVPDSSSSRHGENSAPLAPRKGRAALRRRLRRPSDPPPPCRTGPRACGPSSGLRQCFGGDGGGCPTHHRRVGQGHELACRAVAYGSALAAMATAVRPTTAVSDRATSLRAEQWLTAVLRRRWRRPSDPPPPCLTGPRACGPSSGLWQCFGGDGGGRPTHHHRVGQGHKLVGRAVAHGGASAATAAAVRPTTTMILGQRCVAYYLFLPVKYWTARYR